MDIYVNNKMLSFFSNSKIHNQHNYLSEISILIDIEISNLCTTDIVFYFVTLDLKYFVLARVRMLA